MRTVSVSVKPPLRIVEESTFILWGNRMMAKVSSPIVRSSTSTLRSIIRHLTSRGLNEHIPYLFLDTASDHR